MKTTNFYLYKLYDNERQENFYEVHFGQTGEFQRTTLSEVMKEVERICLANNTQALIEYSPNHTSYVNRSECAGVL